MRALKVKSFLFPLAASTLLTACASSRVSDSDAVPVPADRLHAFQVQTAVTQSTIVVTRDTGFTGGGCSIGLKVDGTIAVGLDTSERAVFFVEPGIHILAIASYGRGLCGLSGLDKAIETVVKPDQTRRYRIGYLAEFSISPE